MKKKETNRKAQRELARKREMEKAMRAKAESEFWWMFTKYFRPWLYELTRQYKERGDYPIMGVWLLPSYYQRLCDVEVAAFAGLLIQGSDERVLKRVADFREMFGESPFEWFRRREFISLGVGNMQEKKTGGVSNRKIASYFSHLYDNWDERRFNIPRILEGTFGEKKIPVFERMLRLILGTQDGFGVGGWVTVPQDVKCPLTNDVLGLIRAFCPDYVKIGGVDAAISLFKFEKDTDFLYAALAYKELQKRNPEGCSRLATVFIKRYKEGNLVNSNGWLTIRRDGILPKIDL